MAKNENIIFWIVGILVVVLFFLTSVTFPLFSFFQTHLYDVNPLSANRISEVNDSATYEFSFDLFDKTAVLTNPACWGISSSSGQSNPQEVELIANVFFPISGITDLRENISSEFVSRAYEISVGNCGDVHTGAFFFTKDPVTSCVFKGDGFLCVFGVTAVVSESYSVSASSGSFQVKMFKGICNTDADTDCDGIVSRSEIGVSINNWINGQVTRTELGEAIVAWIN